MSPFFSSYYDCVPKEDVDLLSYLSVHVLPISSICAHNNKDIRVKLKSSLSWCHLAARAVATVFSDKGLRFVDGKLYDIKLDENGPALCHTIHSWCVTKHGSILDVSPVGILSFNPLLFASSSGVEDPTWGFVTNRYQETREVADEIAGLIRSPLFQNGFPVYVSILKSARKKVDQLLSENKKAKRRKNRDTLLV
jgi:hypothetical protein